jgi:hypothetical protein
MSPRVTVLSFRRDAGTAEDFIAQLGGGALEKVHIRPLGRRRLTTLLPAL